MNFKNWLESLMALIGCHVWSFEADPKCHWKFYLKVEDLTEAEVVLLQKIVDDKIGAPFECVVGGFNET